jgi:lipopolysaccharide transport system ATP-binding protein
MNNAVIRVENVGKCYTLSHRREGQQYRVLRDVLTDGVRSLAGRMSGRAAVADAGKEDFWALRDVSFEIKQGDRVGIIGRNGAGKSTLLKVLSRIVEPTTGRIGIRGRVASLLEVGTGFHPELTGRENIFLNGAILGMSRGEIARKFDEIVAFAEVEKFLDTPVKRYSSGMYVRLAFAVAAHLEPEILIVDEVLAVGDAQFQKKCLGKMEDVAGEGRTVIFVSHNMDAVQRLCGSCIWLSDGHLRDSGATKSILANYLSSVSNIGQGQPNQWIDLATTPRTAGNKKSYFSRLRYSGEYQRDSSSIRSNRQLICDLEIQADTNRNISSLSVILFDQSGLKLINTDTLSIGRVLNLKAGHNQLQMRIDSLHLKPGIYHLGLWLNDAGEILDYIENATEIEVEASVTNKFGSTPGGDGVVACEFDILHTGMPAICK